MIAQNRGGSERRTPNVGGMAPSHIRCRGMAPSHIIRCRGHGYLPHQISGALPLQRGVFEQGLFMPAGARHARDVLVLATALCPSVRDDRAVDKSRLSATEEERVVPRRGLEPPLHFYN